MQPDEAEDTGPLLPLFLYSLQYIWLS
jgi:hypothetical protein